MCENHGSSSRRVQVCSGGSAEIGGRPYSRFGPSQFSFGSSSSSAGITATFSELKCSMSWAIAVTSS